MVLYPPTHEIFIVGGRRSGHKWIPDMHSFVHTSLATQRLALDPTIVNSVSAARVCIDEELGEIYMYVISSPNTHPPILTHVCVPHSLMWQNNNERERSRVLEPATFATYHIEKKRWVRSEPRLGSFNPNANDDVWEGLELPRPRSAHQLEYDPVKKVFYM